MFVVESLRKLVVVAALVSCLILPGCSGSPAPEDKRPNVLLIVVDTLRADRLGCYGAERETSPAIDEFAASAVRFDRAYSTAPWTIPSVASMFSGRFPSSHATTSFDRQLPDELQTLAEALREAGYGTAGVISHVALDSRHNFDQGFEVYLESEALGHDHLSTEGVTRQALEQLDRLAGEPAPFLLFAHYFDPHYNYLRHPEYGFAPESAGRLDGTAPMRELLPMAESMSPEEARFLRDLYDGEVRYTDQGIGRLLQRLDELELSDETIVVLTADHGEEFLEHGNLGHTSSLYEELIHVPLIIRDPGRKKPEPAVVSRPVSLVSLMPTLLGLAGLQVDEGRYQGPSLEPLLAGADSDDEPLLFVELDFVPVRAGRHVGTVHKKALLGDRYKLIRDDSTGALELYDLLDDPDELANLAQTDGERLTRFEALLIRATELASSHAVAPQSKEVDESEIERLKELGYVGD